MSQQPGTTQAAAPAHEVARASVSRAIYGLITVLAVLQVMGAHPPSAWHGTASLFGTTLAVALADAYSDSIGEMLSEGHRLSRGSFRAIGHDVWPILTGAQLPTFVLLASALGLISVELAISLAEWVAFLMLFGFGVRVGQMLHERWFLRLMSGIVLVAIAGLIVAIKAAFH